ncbi:MAG TPA: anaerobic ribonucleoside-triphosphate reductase activating protein [Spirochaetia bacterium]|nr:anaerobic ribonucleoside-triphosphate reductase activating protein [Spirochaetia bacterium]
MTIGGFQKVSLSDFPSTIASIIFTRGCGFRCPYCYNPELVDTEQFAPAIPLKEILSFLRSRSGRIEGVVITGGEPTVHADLPNVLAELRSMGLRTKLDTNGSNPAMLRTLMEEHLLDYVAMDLKAPLSRYGEVVRANADCEAILASACCIRESGCAHEFRTVWARPLLSAADLLWIAELVRGCQRFVVQGFRGGKTLDPQFTAEPVSAAELAALADKLRAAGHTVTVR